MEDEKSGSAVPDMASANDGRAKRRFDWKQKMLGSRSKNGTNRGRDSDLEETVSEKRPPKWNMGILNDYETEEVSQPIAGGYITLRDA